MSASRKATWFTIVLCALLMLATGCNKQAVSPKALPLVKVIETKPQPVSVILEYVGQVEPQQEVQVRARVSGQIVERYAPGGQMVSKGQALFKIDPQPYDMSVLDVQGQLAESQASLSQQRQNLARLSRLVQAGAVSQQEYDNAVEQEKQLFARVKSSAARLEKANLDVQNTEITAPISGRMDTSNMAIGNYVQQGSTVLATISSVDPVLVRFSLSESEYLRFTKLYALRAQVVENSANLEIVLEDGSVYPEKGKVVQIDRGLASGTGTLTLKAEFPNPSGMLLAGMFARIRAPSETRVDAILVPQRAVQDLMGKSMITVVGEGDKAEMRAVTTGSRVGSLWLIESGLQPGERVIVDGTQKARPGQQVAVELVDIEQYRQQRAQ